MDPTVWCVDPSGAVDESSVYIPSHCRAQGEEPQSHSASFQQHLFVWVRALVVAACARHKLEEQSGECTKVEES